jgi:hypothetical protein
MCKYYTSYVTTTTNIRSKYYTSYVTITTNIRSKYYTSYVTTTTTLGVNNTHHLLIMFVVVVA